MRQKRKDERDKEVCEGIVYKEKKRKQMKAREKSYVREEKMSGRQIRESR